MGNYLCIFVILIFFILSTIFIKKYNNTIRKKNKNPACVDIMNKNLFSLFGIKSCIWNLSHVLIYFFICYLIEAKFSIKKHLLVFIFGIIWYISCPYYKKGCYKCNNENDIVYENTDQPRLDDIIFNTTGQLLYILLFYFKIIN
jgi:hypothetical protein